MPCICCITCTHAWFESCFLENPTFECLLSESRKFKCHPAIIFWYFEKLYSELWQKPQVKTLKMCHWNNTMFHSSNVEACGFQIKVFPFTYKSSTSLSSKSTFKVKLVRERMIWGSPNSLSSQRWLPCYLNWPFIINCMYQSGCDILLNMINKLDVYVELEVYTWKSLFLPLRNVLGKVLMIS